MVFVPLKDCGAPILTKKFIKLKIGDLNKMR